MALLTQPPAPGPRPFVVRLTVRPSLGFPNYMKFDAYCNFRSPDGEPMYVEGFVNYPDEKLYNHPSLDRGTYPELHTIGERVLELLDEQEGAEPR